ncbi:MAG TPA: universal stress protein [Streptosporangiaceae bacterium]|nr:universal stress protein [Streptosporangiaceae bacterium]
MSGSGIVVGADGSEESLRAVDWAADEAHLQGASLRIVSVAELWQFEEPLEHLTDPAKAVVYTQLTNAEQAAKDAAEAAAERAAERVPGLTIEPLWPSGSPAQELIASAASSLMLVVGCRGAGGFAGLALGSKSRHLATHAQVPVVVVREEVMPSRAEIVVGVHTPRQARAALTFGFREAQLRGGSLRVVEAVTPGRMAAMADVDGDVLRATKEVLYAHLERWRREYGVETTVDIVRAHPGSILAADSARAGLVVLGRHGGHSGALGAVIHAVLAHAHGPVAVVPGD